MVAEVIARDEELATVEAFLARPGDGPSALVLEGEAGIGKSTLWKAGVTSAARRYPHVLTSRPAESERAFAHVVLGDLFRELPTEVLERLPPPRRRAFEAALLVDGSANTVVDPRALGAAVLTILTQLAGTGPLLLAIDDDQWADRFSIGALQFALRRLPEAGIRLLLARRTDGSGREPGPERRLEASIEPELIQRVRVGPLSVGALQVLLQSRLGVTLPRPRLLRLAEASGGNAFFALELAQAQPSVPSGPPGPLVVPATLERLLVGRLSGFDAKTGRTLLLIAAHGRPPRELLARLGVAPAALERALAAEVVEASGAGLRFSHPLLASTVYQRAKPEERRTAHLDLAAAVDEPIGRARHLALGTVAPDNAAAAALESAADLARQRGLPGVAAELAEHALRLTPADRAEDAWRRGALAARGHLAAGEAAQARALIDAQRAVDMPEAQQAEALILAAQLEAPGPAVSLLQLAMEQAADVPAVRAAVEARLAEVGRFVHGRDWAERHARSALAEAERLDDDRLRVRCRCVLAMLRFEAADPEALDLAFEAYRRAQLLDDPELTRLATWVVGHQLTWLRRTEEARHWLERAVAEASERDELLRADCLWYLALVELWAGRWDVAWEHAHDSAEIDRQYGIERPQDHMPLALIALHRGQIDLARDHSTRALALAEGMMLPTHTAILGAADLWSGRPDDALPRLEAARELSDRRGAHDPILFWVGRAEHVEALLQTGHIDDAERIASLWETARATDHEWTAAEVIRSKGLIAAARGDLDHAVEHLVEAARRHEQLGDPFARGRALLALGQVRRRQRQKRQAREALEAALATFEALGAKGFSEAARRELRQLGGRRRLEGLSPSERRVAELVVEGRTNREIAAALFLGDRTVASHLTHVYAKLGVRSRTELTRRWADEGLAVEIARSNLQTS